MRDGLIAVVSVAAFVWAQVSAHRRARLVRDGLDALTRTLTWAVTTETLTSGTSEPEPEPEVHEAAEALNESETT